jgi:hypothetical protein
MPLFHPCILDVDHRLMLHLFVSSLSFQPKHITDIRDFLQKARRRDAKLVKIRKRSDGTKFKIRCSK